MSQLFGLILLQTFVYNYFFTTNFVAYGYFCHKISLLLSFIFTTNTAYGYFFYSHFVLSILNLLQDLFEFEAWDKWIRLLALGLIWTNKSSPFFALIFLAPEFTYEKQLKWHSFLKRGTRYYTALLLLAHIFATPLFTIFVYIY